MKSLIDASLQLWSEWALVHMCVFIHAYTVHVCRDMNVCTDAHLRVCSIHRGRVYIVKVLSSLFEGSSNGLQRAGGLERAWAGMWDRLSHIDSILFACVCSFLSHVCAWPLPRLVQSVIHLSTRLWTLCPSSFYWSYRPAIVNTRSQILPFTSSYRVSV